MRAVAGGGAAEGEEAHLLDDALHSLARGIEDAARGAFALNSPADGGVGADAVHVEFPSADLLAWFRALISGATAPAGPNAWDWAPTAQAIRPFSTAPSPADVSHSVLLPILPPPTGRSNSCPRVPGPECEGWPRRGAAPSDLAFLHLAMCASSSKRGYSISQPGHGTWIW